MDEGIRTDDLMFAMTESFVGKFFHSFHESGEINRQGYVASYNGSDRYTVVLFSWLTGTEKGTENLSGEDLMDCVIYDSIESMRYAYESMADFEKILGDANPIESKDAFLFIARFHYDNLKPSNLKPWEQQKQA